MTARTWSGGNWSDTTKWTGSTLPTASDDVTVASGTFSGTIDVSNAICRSIDLTNGSNNTTLTFNAGSVLTIGTNTTAGFHFKFPTSGAKSGITDNGGQIVLASTSGSNSISTSSFTLPQLLVGVTGAGVGAGNSSGKYTFGSAITCNTSLSLAQGIIDLNGQTITTPKLLGSFTFTRSIAMGASSVSITGSGTALDFGTTTNLTLTRGTSTVTFNYTTDSTLVSADFGGQSFNNITVNCQSFKHINNTLVCIGTYTLSGVSGACQNLKLGTNLSVNGTFIASAPNVTSRIVVQSDTLGTARAINIGTASVAGTATLSNVIFQDITFSNLKNLGTAYTGTNVGDAGGNVGDITTQSPVTQYWVGGTGSWSANTTHWSTSSGGSAGGSARVPLPQDTININNSSGFLSGGTITIDINDMWLPSINASGALTTGYTITDSTGVGWNITGNVAFQAGTTVTPTAQFIDTYGRGTQTWTSSTCTYSPFFLEVFNFGGTLRFTDDLTGGINIVLNNGTLDASTNSVTLNIASIVDAGTATKAVTLASGKTLTLTGLGGGFFTNILNLTSSGTTFTTNSSNLVYATSSTTTRILNFGGKTWGNITLSGLGSGTFTINGGGTCSILSLSGTIGALQVATGTTLTVSDFQAWGSSGNLIVITSSAAGVAFTISKSSGIIVCDWISLKDCTASGGLSKAYAGGNSTNVSGNTGWTFTSDPFDNAKNPLNGTPQTQVVRQSKVRASFW